LKSSIDHQAWSAWHCCNHASCLGRDNWEDFTHHRYTFITPSKLVITNKVKIGNGILDLPRIGVSISLQPTLEQLEWYGRGPWENYPDRKYASMIGHYSSTVSEQYVPYIMPQEHGHKTDVRWLTLLDQYGQGIKVEGFPTIGVFCKSFFSKRLIFSQAHL
jgi:beta-galactosidase